MKSGEKEKVPSEQTLRRHIRRILTEAGFQGTATLLRRVEDEVLLLFGDYSRAPKSVREKTYNKGRKRIVETMRS